MKGLSVLIVVFALGTPAAYAQNPIPVPIKMDVRAEARKVLNHFAGEPSVLQVQRAAARYARVNRSSYRSWVKASNYAHLLPERVKGQLLKLKREEADVRTTSSTQSLSELLAVDDHMRLELEIQWDFSKLIFNPDKLKVSKEISNLVELREEILTTVNKLYFARRRLQVLQLLNPPKSVRKAIYLKLRIDSLTADIDALTGGWFSRTLKAKIKAKLKGKRKAHQFLKK